MNDLSPSVWTGDTEGSPVSEHTKFLLYDSVIIPLKQAGKATAY